MNDIDVNKDGRIDMMEWMKYLDEKRSQKGRTKFGFFLSFLRKSFAQQRAVRAEVDAAHKETVAEAEVILRLQRLNDIISNLDRVAGGTTQDYIPVMVAELVHHGVPEGLAVTSLRATASTPETGFKPALSHLALYTGLPVMIATMKCLTYANEEYYAAIKLLDMKLKEGLLEVDEFHKLVEMEIKKEESHLELQLQASPESARDHYMVLTGTVLAVYNDEADFHNKASPFLAVQIQGSDIHTHAKSSLSDGICIIHNDPNAPGCGLWLTGEKLHHGYDGLKYDAWFSALTLASKGQSDMAAHLSGAEETGWLYKETKGFFGCVSHTKCALVLADGCIKAYDSDQVETQSISSLPSTPAYSLTCDGLSVHYDTDYPFSFTLMGEDILSEYGKSVGGRGQLVFLHSNPDVILKWVDSIQKFRDTAITAIHEEKRRGYVEGRLGAGNLMMNSPHAETSTMARGLILSCLDYAKNSRQEFTSGSFFIVDRVGGRDHTLFDMLHRSSAVYPRTSSHLHDVPPHQPDQFGVDIKEIDLIVDDVHVIIRTVLFCQFSLNGTPILFIKPENYGLRSVGDTISHGVDYIKTRQMVTTLIGGKEGPKRKERIPSSWKNKFKELAKETNVSKDVISRAAKTGVYAMLLALECPTNQDRLRAFISKDVFGGQEMKVPFDGLSRGMLENELMFWSRVGNEVFVPQAEVMRIAQMAMLRHPPDVRESIIQQIMDSSISVGAAANGISAQELTLKVMLASKMASKHFAAHLLQDAGGTTTASSELVLKGDDGTPEEQINKICELAREEAGLPSHCGEHAADPSVKGRGGWKLVEKSPKDHGWFLKILRRVETFVSDSSIWQTLEAYEDLRTDEKAPGDLY